jgi:hypothetical protein
VSLPPIVTTYILSRDGHEIAVTYFRAGYGPEDYPSEKVKREGVCVWKLITLLYRNGVPD